MSRKAGKNTAAFPQNQYKGKERKVQFDFLPYYFHTSLEQLILFYSFDT